MSTPKPEREPERAKTSDEKSQSYNVKFSNKTGGAYAEMKAVIQSERQNWNKTGDTCGESDNASNKNDTQK